MKIKPILATILSAIVLAYLGVLLYGRILTILLPKAEGVYYNTGLDDFSIGLWFGAMCGLLPVLIFLSWVITRTRDLRSKLLSAGIVVVFALAALIIRYFMVKATVMEISQFSRVLGEHEYRIDLSTLKYNFYFFFGQLVGFIVAALVLNSRRMKAEQERTVLD